MLPLHHIRIERFASSRRRASFQPFTVLSLNFRSDIGESNSCILHGKQSHYHCANIALYCTCIYLAFITLSWTFNFFPNPWLNFFLKYTITMTSLTHYPFCHALPRGSRTPTCWLTINYANLYTTKAWSWRQEITVKSLDERTFNVSTEGFEPPTSSFVAKRSIHWAMRTWCKQASGLPGCYLLTCTTLPYR